MLGPDVDPTLDRKRLAQVDNIDSTFERSNTGTEVWLLAQL
jgi:hypothetical protein